MCGYRKISCLPVYRWCLLYGNFHITTLSQETPILARAEGLRANMGIGLIWGEIWTLTSNNLFIIYFQFHYKTLKGLMLLWGHCFMFHTKSKYINTKQLWVFFPCIGTRNCTPQFCSTVRSLLLLQCYLSKCWN